MKRYLRTGEYKKIRIKLKFSTENVKRNRWRKKAMKAERLSQLWLWHNVRVFVSVGVDECQSEDSFVCFGKKPTQRTCARDILGDRKKTREGKVPEQSTEETSQQNTGKGDREKRLPSEESGPVALKNQDSQRERMSQRSWWLYGNFGRIHIRDSQMHRKPHKSVTNFFLLALGANPSSCWFVLLFFHPLGCVCCVLFVKQC